MIRSTKYLNDLTKLTELSISSNLISKFPEISKFKNLKILKYSNNFFNKYQLYLIKYYLIKYKVF